MIEVYGDTRSGNCLKVKWILEYLSRSYDWHHIEFLKGETRTEEFLRMNPAGQVPVVVLDDGRPLAQSNAILLHFAEGSDLIPSDAYERAIMHEWMFWEQYSHEPTLAVRRFQKVYLGRSQDEIEPTLLTKGNAALAKMEARLADFPWLVGAEVTLADLCLLPYTMLAEEGGYQLSSFPAVMGWVERASGIFRPIDDRHRPC